MCQALWGAELNRGSVQVKWFLIHPVTQNESALSGCDHQEHCCLWLQRQYPSFGGCADVGQHTWGEAPGSEGSPVSLVWPPHHIEFSALFQTASSEASQHKQFSTLKRDACDRGGGKVAPRGILRVSHELCIHLELFCWVHLLAKAATACASYAAG